MLRFTSDYMEGAHPAILKRLSEKNLEKNIGYGEDEYCHSAEKKILDACNLKEGKVIFLVGGTQTNAFAIDEMLDKCDGVLCAENGHINCHEAGAVECWGHKVLTMPAVEGKITAEGLKKYCVKAFAESSVEHTVVPGMVYISNPTEFGTLYSYSELKEIQKVCKEYEMPIFIDGARLGYGLAVKGYDVDLPRLAECCDAFYIGGTKVGMLFGEAIVCVNPKFFKRRITLVKRHGALLAKGWLLGVQFDTLFTDNLYMKISRNAVDQAMRLREVMLNHGYKLAIDSPTNQQFFVMPNADLKRMEEKAECTIWEPADENNTIVRFVTSWATTLQQVEELDNILTSIK